MTRLFRSLTILLKTLTLGLIVLAPIEASGAESLSTTSPTGVEAELEGAEESKHRRARLRFEPTARWPQRVERAPEAAAPQPAAQQSPATVRPGDVSPPMRRHLASVRLRGYRPH